MTKKEWIEQISGLLEECNDEKFFYFIRGVIMRQLKH